MTGHTTWTPEAVLDAIRAREAASRPLSYQAVVNDDERLTGAARRMFGGWGAALSAAGFDPEAIKRAARQVTVENRRPPGFWTPETVIAEIQQAARSGQDLSAHRMQQIDGGLVGAAQNLFGGWDKALTAAGYAPDLIRRARAWTNEQIIERIQQLARDGADLSERNAEAFDNSLYGASYEHFGSWPAAVEAAGLDPGETRRTVRWSRSRVLEAIRAGRRDDVMQSIAYDYFPTWSEALREAGLPDEPSAAVGNRVRERRETLRMSQTELGQRVGCSHRWISMIELGQVPDPRVSFALKLAQVLGCRVEELFEVKGKQETPVG